MRQQPNLKLMDDPVVGILWMLRQLPVETSADYLALLLAYAVEHQLISEPDRIRITGLLEQISSDVNYRAA